MRLLLSLVFVLSGAAGLMYESIWSRYLGLFVGHSAYAQVIVLVIFLGGMSAGAALVSRYSARLREPLLWYAGIEAVVGLVGLVFHDIFVAATGFAYDSLFPSLAGSGLLVVAKWGLAAALILPQSILLGATFPLMSAGLLRRFGSESSGRVLGLLYFANSLGAAIGVLVAGFWLIGYAGLPGTLVAAAIVNLVVALVTYGAVRLEMDEDDPPIPGATPEPTVPRSPWRLMLAVSFGTAVASFIYEIAWIRMLSLVLGSATHAFELMLSAFILGLALGALWIRSRADRVKDPMRLLGITQFAMGALAIATVAIYVDAFGWMATLIEVLDENESGYRVYNLARYGISLAVMLPPTFCAGITLPLITRILIGAGNGERAIGAVYAWNTLGSITGVALAALALMPLVGLRAMLVIGGAIDIALGIWLLWKRAADAPQTRQTATLATAAGVAVIAGSAISPAFDPGILTSGVFRYGTVPERGARSVEFYRDGRTATVSVRLGSDSAFSLATNGKPDASISRVWFNEPEGADSLRPTIRGDESTQVLLPMLTLAHVPQAKEAAVIGHGSGVSSHMLLGSPTLERLVTIDIEPQMIEASRLFMPANRRVYEDPRSSFVHDDAKSFFAASGRKFDLILSEPSNPWVSGVSGLFTDEFYQRVRGYLTPGGVFGQWLHLYEIEDALVLSVLEALHRNFPSYAIYLTNDVDVLVVASNEAQLPDPDWAVFGYPDVARDLERFRPITHDALRSALLMGRAELAPLLAGESVNSDFYPQLDLGAERARYLRHSASGFLGITTDRFDVAAALAQRVVPLSDDARASLSFARVESQAMSRRLQRDEQLSPTDTVAANRDFQAARLRAQHLQLQLASGRPPADWFIWFTEMVTVEADRHAGTMGVVDAAWYDGVERYMRAQGAPADGLAALKFLRSAASYRWIDAAREVDALLAARNIGRQWLPLGLFFDAAVVARLHAGDADGARVAFARLSSASGRGADDVRTMLLNAHVAAAERDAPRPGR